jgi:crotonobetainyl-CoA:carnitine CoA-transferase CaiB-like acyl-CoA transferase
MSSPPLQGLRVVSLAEQYPGPYATLLLADLGADVVLVERPGAGDPARQFPAFFSALNRNKRGIALDLKTEAGRSALGALVRHSDVVLDGFRPGKLAALGVGYAQLSAQNRRLVYVSITGYGLTGPYRDRTGHDLSYQGLAGLLADQAVAGTPGPVPAIPLADVCAALFTTIAVLAALSGRQATGVGTHVDVSMSDALVSVMTIYLAPLMNGASIGELFQEPAYRTFACADGQLLTVSIAHEDWFWSPFCHALDLPDLARFTRPERIARSIELRRIVAERIAAQPRAHWAPIFEAKAIPWGPVNRHEEVVRDPHFQARQLFQAIQRPDGVTERHVVQPLKFLDFASRIARPAPTLDEHADEVLREIAAFSSTSASSP